ncbi:TetR/AcrR family transcriptional regulator [Bacillus sp. RG28]|uniref:TetR/AcrR family transcriptional regulator n=1 Tax=Gottfriedia endophytica TaxID=2820819 RepID=A0A940NQB7_9BACI|nr:TetR/AcrR family transcriptional regulator [Gottfriedia endophytica]MBP0726876.1 TetR/AcrR family transcriptional regulator [Gottfriedia endophytica]
MAKKYNSQATIETILSVSAKLFLEKGFDKTSMQDIAKTAGISKGAIYHHFQSKEEIINAVTELQAQIMENMVNGWLSEMGTCTGKEKLISLLEKSFTSQEAHNLDDVMASRVKSPEFVVSYMKDCVNKDASLIAEIIKEGIADGSIITDFPEECAEVFLLLLNIWCDPVIFECNHAKVAMRLKFLQHLLKSIGMDILHDDLFVKIKELLQKLYPEEHKTNE